LRKQKLRLPVILAATLAAATVALDAACAGTTPNLLVNGDAEAHRCTQDWTASTPVPGWRVLRGAASVVCYAAFNSFGETPITPNAALAGNALFAAPGADTAMEQGIDVSAAHDAIDRRALDYNLSAWLGGWRNRPERATLTAVFLDATGHATGDPVALADVDAKARKNVTALVARQATGRVPPRTRKIVVTVEFISGFTSFQNAYADHVSLTLSGDVGALERARLEPPQSLIPPLDHVFLVMMENTGQHDVVHQRRRALSIDSNMPFLAGLAADGVTLTNMWGTYHPSDQNYVAMVAGDTYKFGPVYYPDYNLPVTHLGDLLDSHGVSWRAYVQNMKKPCNLASDPSGQGNFAPDDEPFAHFKDVIANAPRCVTALRDLKDFEAAIATNSLPLFAWIAADGYWDGEGAWFVNFDMPFSLSVQDKFLRSTFAPLLSSAAWRNSRSLLIITWDEAAGWGWPDNLAPTIVVGSPGLLHKGAVVQDHYDGYGVLRTVESALGTPSLGRFDAFATPLNSVFAPSQTGPDLQADLSAATRGGSADSFGQPTTPVAVDQGQALRLLGPQKGDDDDVFVNIEPLNRAPSRNSVRYGFDDDGVAAIPTDKLAPGFYGAWLRRGSEPPHRAPIPINVLAPGHVRPDAPGVEIVGAPDNGAKLEVREGANFIVRYCTQRGGTVANSWIGIFADGTPLGQMTKDNANLVGNWLKTPGASQSPPCGEALAYPAELAPGLDYHVYLFQDVGNGAAKVIGASAAFALTHTLP